jgi:hypothetical protein
LLAALEGAGYDSPTRICFSSVSPHRMQAPSKFSSPSAAQPQLHPPA